jgi:hypothetical protein
MAEPFIVRRKVEQKKLLEAILGVFALPWAVVIWFLFLCEALGFELPVGTNKWMVIPIAAVFLPIQWTAARALFDRRDRLVADARGVLWRPWSETVIPWAEIRRVRPHTVWGLQHYVILDLHHPQRYPATSGLRWTAWANRKAGYGDVAIQTDGTDTEPAELGRVIEQFRKAAAAPGTRP